MNANIISKRKSATKFFKTYKIEPRSFSVTESIRKGNKIDPSISCSVERLKSSYVFNDYKLFDLIFTLNLYNYSFSCTYNPSFKRISYQDINLRMS